MRSISCRQSCRATDVGEVGQHPVAVVLEKAAPDAVVTKRLAEDNSGVAHARFGVGKRRAKKRDPKAAGEVAEELQHGNPILVKVAWRGDRRASMARISFRFAALVRVAVGDVKWMSVFINI